MGKTILTVYKGNKNQTLLWTKQGVTLIFIIDDQCGT